MFQSICQKLCDYFSKLRSRPRAKAKPPPLLRLSAELYLEIVSHLDAFSAVSLKITCRHLYSVLPTPAGGLDRAIRLRVLEQFPPREPHNGAPPMLCEGCVKYHPPDWEVRVSRIRGISGFTRRGRRLFLVLTGSADAAAEAPPMTCVGHPPDPGQRPMRECQPCRRCLRYGAIRHARMPDMRGLFMLCRCERARFVLMAEVGSDSWQNRRDTAFWWSRDTRDSIW